MTCERRHLHRLLLARRVAGRPNKGWAPRPPVKMGTLPQGAIHSGRNRRNIGGMRDDFVERPS
ncbi:MAG: hypothetical protein ACXVIJ_10535, partial [Thermoanaerobaculia bacterium]